MQETFFKQWQDLNQISLDWYRDTSESQVAAINDWMGLQSDPGAWAKFAKSSLESFRSWSDLGESKISDLWQAQIGKLDLDGVAAALRELGGIQTSACTALFKTQTGLMSLYTDTTAQYLDLLKQAKSVEDLIATQAHIATGVQDKLKSYSLEGLQIAGSVKAAMSAWAEKALDTAAAQDEKAAPASAPRRISKKTEPSA
ncbi:MAG: phasin family protein [Gammaproteobacteria bacterium]